MPNLDLSRVPVFYHKYIANVKEDELGAALRNHQSELLSELEKIPAEKWDYRYAEGKWSIKEMVQHLIDAERIFCYRALNFARKDSNELPGFDENMFAETSKADKRTKNDLLEELTNIQKGSALLFGSFDEEQLNQSGIANGWSIYVKAIGFIIAGHTLHHRNILLERYL
jgi:hypothetical protein